MPQLQPIIVNDGEDTPVSHTFTPATRDENGVARLRETDGTPIGDNIITLSLRETDTKFKGRIVLAMPVVVDQTINGAVVPTVVRTAHADLTVTFDKTSTRQERENTLTILSNAVLDNTGIVPAMFMDLEGIWG